MWESIRNSVFTPARIVPLVIMAVGAGVTALTGWLAANNFNLDPSIVTGIVVPIALGAAASAFKWQDGWQKYEARTEVSPLDVRGDLHPDEGYDEPPLNDLDRERAKEREHDKMASGGNA